MKHFRFPLLAALAALPCVSARADITGFGTNGAGYTQNQGQTVGGLTVAGDIAQLTDGKNSEGNSLFYNTPQAIGMFTVAFTYQDKGGSALTSTADGFTFTLQNDPRGTGAVGGPGASLAYNGAGGTTSHNSISLSAAVCFDIFTQSTTGLGTNGTVNLANASLANLNSGNPINIKLAYNGTTLTETLTDTSTNVTSTFNYATNLTSLLGNTAYVGFTGSDGSTVSTQTISNFTFTSNVVPEPSTCVLSALSALVGVVFLRRRVTGASR